MKHIFFLALKEEGPQTFWVTGGDLPEYGQNPNGETGAVVRTAKQAVRFVHRCFGSGERSEDYQFFFVKFRCARCGYAESCCASGNSHVFEPKASVSLVSLVG